jgi:hypothetical protein
MDRSAIIEKLREGYELANRGSGWKVIKAGKPDQSLKGIEIESSTVTALVVAGLISVKRLELSLRARLIR